MKELLDETFGVSEAARLSGLTPKQLRYWEERGYIPVPRRMNYGNRKHRQFSQPEIKLIQSIKSHLDEGYSLSPAARMASAKIKNIKEVDHETN